MKSFSAASQQNKTSILEVLKSTLSAVDSVLEIGSGTGQHAVYFGAELTHLCWQTSELEQKHASILAWLQESGLSNVLPPISLDVGKEWPKRHFEAVFSANTTHIMSWSQVEQMYSGVGHILQSNGLFVLYGPFNIGGNYTSASNCRFDVRLKQKDPESGIRNFEDLNRLAEGHQLLFEQEVAMPANNKILIWRRK